MILEDNARIAEWMGYITKIYNYQDTINPAIKIFMGIEEENPAITIKQGTTERLYQPHKDWNQLMEVVEKIEKDGYEVEIWGNNCKISHPETSFNLWRDSETKQQAVYQAVLEYIKQQKEG